MGKHGESVVVGQILTRKRKEGGKEPSGLGRKKELGFFLFYPVCCRV